jgi:hypothetical protein
MQQNHVVLLFVCAVAVIAAIVVVAQITGLTRRLDGRPKRDKKDGGAESGFNL